MKKTNKTRNEIVNESRKKTQMQINITLKKEKGEIIKEAAKKSGKSCNAFIIDIVLEYIENNKI